MTAKTKQKFIELRDAWANHALSVIRREKKKRFISGLFEIGLLKKINPKKVVAVLAVMINTPLPTASLVTNPILYKKIMKFDWDKLERKINLMKARLR